MAIYKVGIIHPRLEFLGVEVCLLFGFCAIILALDMLESQSSALNTRMIV